MKSGAGLIYIALLIAVATSSGAREILQTSPCASFGSKLGNGVCNSLLAQQNALSNTNASDQQIQVYAALAPPPSPECCSAMKEIATSRCQCDPGVIAVASNYDVSRDQLVLFARYAKIACGTQYIPANANPYCNGSAVLPPSSG